MNPSKAYEAIEPAKFEELLKGPGEYESLESFLESIASGNWIFESSKKEEIFTTLRKHYPDKIKLIVGRAEEAHENCVDVFGSGPTYLGAKIDWHLDFKSGRIWHKDFYQNVPLIFWGDQSDAKVPWELSRLHSLVDLAIAYHLTGIQKYHQKYIMLVEDWIYENPCPYGINWANAMEISIRALNWLASYELFDKEMLSINFKSKFFRVLYQHGEMIWENLAHYGPGINHNHYLFDLIGLLVLGRLFGNLPSGKAWYEFAREELENEIFNQISPDGTCYESSLNYQIVMLELYLFAMNFEKRFGCPFSDEVKARLMQSCAALYMLAKHDGTVPNFGDSGSDRLFKLERRDEHNIQHILDLASVVVDLKGYSTGQVRPALDLLFWVGPEGLSKYFDNLVIGSRKKVSVYFGDSGLAVLRGKQGYLGFFANSVSRAGFGGHKHNDILALEFSHGDADFVVDSGTYVYTGDPSRRNFFRRTASHSTLEVDGQEINRFLPKILFSIRKDAEVREIEWETNSDYDKISAEHSGYSRLESPIIARRTIYFDKKDSIYLIKDDFLGSGRHLLCGNIILNSGIGAEISKNQVILKSASGPMAMIIMSSAQWDLEKVPHYISRSYGQKLDSWRIRYSMLEKAPQNCVWGLFGADSCREMQKKNLRFYAILDEIGWREKVPAKLRLKRGEEVVLSEKALESALNPGFKRIINGTEKVVAKESEEEPF